MEAADTTRRKIFMDGSGQLGGSQAPLRSLLIFCSCSSLLLLSPFSFLLSSPLLAVPFLETRAWPCSRVLGFAKHLQRFMVGNMILFAVFLLMLVTGGTQRRGVEVFTETFLILFAE